VFDTLADPKGEGIAIVLEKQPTAVEVKTQSSKPERTDKA